MNDFVVIDIGACVGEFFKQYLDKPNVIIHAFEPLKVNFQYLQENYSDPRVKLYPWAVSNFDGESNFYKKFKVVNGKRQYDYVTCAGSSLKQDKKNVDPSVFEKVKVIKISTFVRQNDIKKIDVLKIDVEGSEYDVIEDVLESHLYEIADFIHYEDHTRKLRSIKAKRDTILEQINSLGIQEKFKLGN
jgi:FkbM family methyltransferase